ncbi:MAG: hypothetical protein M1360_00575 [Candidatus Marsarchaeota archaeon]|jgi:spermidine synthase|nr:hypothetical protein [Candidatus Marsarchaeota archaeon]MCL5418420.1 hypothetical protein [Candidatus Marsarchaeota archaeon]
MKLVDSIEALIKGKLIASIREPRAYIEVRERKGERTLLYNGITFSRVRKDSLFTYGYWDYFMPLPSVFNKANVLIIGLGGGTVPYQLETLYSDISIDAVEINPNMASMAKVFLPRSLRSRIIIANGVDFVKMASGAYDLIILDTYINARIPSEFMGSAFIQDAYKALKQKGILAINYALSSDNTPYFDDYKGRLKCCFKVGIVGAYNLGNRIMVCMKGIDKEELDRAVQGFGSKKIANDYISMKTL